MAVATWSARHRWTALLLWIAFVVAAVVGGAAVSGNDLDESTMTVGASGAADTAMADADFGDVPNESILIQAADGGTLDSASASEAAQALSAAAAAVPGVASVVEPAPSADGSSLLVQVSLVEPDGNGDAEHRVLAQVAADLQEAVEPVASEYPELWIGQVGNASLSSAIDQVVADDFRLAEMLSLPVTLAILAVVFGALIAAGVPVLLAFSSVGAALGLSTFASYLVPTSELLASVVLLIGMAVGVDYSLFYIRRAREQRNNGDAVGRAIEVAAATSGRAVVISGLTTVVAMAGMFLAGLAVFDSFAIGTILVIGVAVVGSLTVLPALLSLLGRWVDRPRIPVLWRLTRREGGARFWPAVLRPVLRRPAAAFTIGVVGLGALAAPAVSMTLGEPDLEDLPGSIVEVDTLNRLSEAYPREGTVHTVAIWTEDGSALDVASVESAVSELTRSTSADSLFADAEASVLEVATEGNVAQLPVPVAGGLDDAQEAESLETLRALVDETVASFAGIAAGVTGPIAWDADFRGQLGERLPYVIGFVLLLSVVVLILAFRSLTIALTAAGLNLLSVGAAYGLLVLVFQNTWAEGLLGFTSTGAIVTWVPLFLFVILFGLSMDYHIFVVSRIREGRALGMPTRQAIEHGITASAGVVSSAAFVMVAVFSIFTTLSMIEFKQMGVGMAAAILIDATIVRAIVLPAAMRLLGERNWWLPRPLNRLNRLRVVGG
ncbi:MMPL family transporter [Phytoactinopolyspora limicola]|uniref:MMPL family transporter n=1 Tax=Phytoactinopolyspora limicola TaxID=2715536 RepID=UPI001A9C427B|nr:MMPL family transporter [Phytoactinopolyspora limicola]